MINPMPQAPYGPRLTDKAYPLAIFAGDAHVTPEKIRLEITDGRLHLWIGPMSITVDLKGADESLTGGAQVLARLRQESERAGAYVAAEENGRAARAAAEASAAADNAAEHHQAAPPEQHGHPYAETAQRGDAVVYPIAPA